jgi:hypothetical protein
MNRKNGIAAGPGVFEAPCLFNECKKVLRSDKSQMYADKARRIHEAKEHGLVSARPKKFDIHHDRLDDDNINPNSLLAYCRGRAESTTNYAKVLDIWISSR